MTTADKRNDSELLLAYSVQGEQAAFEALAARHVDMIFAVSLRRSGNRQMAEEATQNVLICLSIKARKLSRREYNLAGWLHKSTRFEIAKLQRHEARLKKREEAYASELMKTSIPDEEAAFRRLLPVLDQAIDHLGAPDREVIVRRYLEEQDFRQIGKALGISEDAAQKRTNRAFERLNRFFKRKAGVTVSATAFAVGIGQHCAEAAPISCLNIAGKAASTGVASHLTAATITTMSIGKAAAVAAVVVVLGVSVAVIATKSDDPTESASAVPPSTGGSASGNSSAPERSARPGATGNIAEDPKPYSPNEELAKLEAASPHPGKDEFARRLSVKHERLLKDLIDDLGLSAAQSGSLKEVLDARLKHFRAALDIDPEVGGQSGAEMAMLTKAGGIIRGVGLREELVGVLSDDQLAAFDQHEVKAWQTQVESLTYRELSKLTPVLNLTEDQKDRTFELLQTSSAATLKESADIRAFMALQAGKSPAAMELTDLEEASFLAGAFEGPTPTSPDSPEFKERILDVVGRQIRGKVGTLAPVLDEGQEKRYTEHLYQKSVLPIIGIKLPKSE